MIRGANKWLWPVLKHRMLCSVRRPQRVFLAICDHFEPMHHTDAQGALTRLLRWRDGYLAQSAKVRDSGGRGPRHTFFYPIEQYQPEHLEVVAQICSATGSEIEVQLHHDRDTVDTLLAKLERGIEDLSAHGALAVDHEGRTRFGFVHGNWALCNSRPDGRWCGVPSELGLLRGLGCYADFTFPSAPSETQPRSVNQIGYATESGSAAALDQLDAACLGSTNGYRHERDRLLIVQGPLALNWRRRKLCLFPRLENADLTSANPPTSGRLDLWLEQKIHVRGREDWHFIKLHTHGAAPPNSDMFLGAAMAEFNNHFTKVFPAGTGITTHYVTAREMVNLIHAAEDGYAGHPDECLNYHLNLRSPQAG